MRYNYYMWSNKKSVNIIVNILLFLLSMNFLHYGQIFLPIICLILFVDNKFKLNINDIKLFVVLCLFGITFFAFTYKMGLYCIIGFCLPMSYYIGSNLKEKNEKSVLKIIYILAFGMASHVILNFAYELILCGISVVDKVHHYDVWTGEYISTTGTAVNYTFIISLIYHIVFKEKNKKLRNVGIILFIVLFVYNIALGRRTPVLMFIIAAMLSFVLDYFVYKTNIISNKVIIIGIFCIICLVFTSIVIYEFNVLDIQNRLFHVNLLRKFYNFGLNPERLELFMAGLKLMPHHLFGGQQISLEIGDQIHDLWMDTYDYAGIIPFILLLIYTYLVIKNVVVITKNCIINKSLFITFFICVLLQLLLEPVITGSSLFLICIVIVISSYQTLRENNEKQRKSKL